jgi:hypothetical protein
MAYYLINLLYHFLSSSSPETTTKNFTFVSFFPSKTAVMADRSSNDYSVVTAVQDQEIIVVALAFRVFTLVAQTDENCYSRDKLNSVE